MALSSQLTIDFKQAAVDIFDSMASSERLGFIFEPNTVDPVTQLVTKGECHAVRSLLPNIPKERFITGLGDTYKIGDTIGYIVYDEVPFKIEIGSEFRLPFDENIALVDPNNDCFPEGGPIVAGGALTLAPDFIIAGDSTELQELNSTTMSAEIYTVTRVEVDAAEAAYKLTLRLK